MERDGVAHSHGVTHGHVSHANFHHDGGSSQQGHTDNNIVRTSEGRPLQEYTAPPSGYEAPSHTYHDGPANTYRSPTHGYGPPSGEYGAPFVGYGAPSDGYGAPSDEYGGYSAPSSGCSVPSDSSMEGLILTHLVPGASASATILTIQAKLGFPLQQLCALP